MTLDLVMDFGYDTKKKKKKKNNQTQATEEKIGVPQVAHQKQI